MKFRFAFSTNCSNVKSVTGVGDASVFNNLYVAGPTAISRIDGFLVAVAMSFAVK